MSMNADVVKALDEQINHELASAYFYLAASAYFESTNLPGAGKWMRLQSQEELAHAMKFFDLVHDRGGRATLLGIAAPEAEFASPLDAFQRALSHEQSVTALIHRLYKLAQERADYALQVLLDWFVAEQVEEEKSATLVVEHLKMAGSDSSALLLIDHQLGERSSG